jgi:hypothetical protein
MATTVNILGIPYTVRRVPYVSRDEYAAAHINYETHEIRILDSLRDEAFGITLFHEVIHGVFTALKYLDESNDEKLVQGLAIGLYQALSSNPAFYNYTREAE